MSTQQQQQLLQAGSSNGSSDDCCKLQVKACAKVGGKLPEGHSHSGCVPVMVSITAPSGMAEQRAPVELVVVLHVRNGCKVPKNWQKLLVKAVKVVVDKLDDKDSLAIVPVQSKLWPMSAENKEAASAAVSSDAIRSDVSLTRALELAELILNSQGMGYDDKESRASNVIVISNSDGDEGSLVGWRFLPVHAFGFRDAHNARTMHTIASNRDCTYAVLDDEHGRMTQAFAASVDRITSAMPVEVKLKCDQEVLLFAIDAPRVSYFISHDKKVGIIWATRHLVGGVTANFLVYLNLPQRDRERYDWPKLFTVHVKYGHAPDRLAGQVIAVPEDTRVSDKEIAAEMVRLKAVRIVADITAKDLNDWEALHAAGAELRQRWTSLIRESGFGVEAGELISGLGAAMSEMEIRLYNNYLWLEYMLSWQSHQWWQLPLPPLFMDKDVEATDDGPLLRLRIYAHFDADALLCGVVPVLVRVMAPEAALAKAKRPPVDLIAVLDTEKKTQKRLELLTNTMDLIMEKLTNNDRLAIVHVQSSVTEPPSARLLDIMSTQGRSRTSTKMQSLGFSNPPPPQQTSHWREQLNKTLKWAMKCLHITPVDTSIPTQTSSFKRQDTTHTTYGVGGSTKLRNALMDAEKILDDRQKGEIEDRVGFIILISDRDDDSIRDLRPKYNIHAFGFYENDTCNTRAMYHIASSSSGIYACLNDSRNQITETFRACINKITSTIATHTRVDIVTHSGSGAASASSLSLKDIESGQFRSSISNDGKSGSIFACALYAGAVKSFIFYLDNVPKDNYDSLCDMFAVRVSWRNALSKAVEELDGQVVIVRDGTDEVQAHIALVEAVKIVRKITDHPFNEEFQLQDMRQLQYMCLQGSDSARAAGEVGLASEMEKVEASLRKQRESYESGVTFKMGPLNYVKELVESKLSYMLSWLSFQGISEQAHSYYLGWEFIR